MEKSPPLYRSSRVLVVRSFVSRMPIHQNAVKTEIQLRELKTLPDLQGSVRVLDRQPFTAGNFKL
jgi:hypothetical protein